MTCICLSFQPNKYVASLVEVLVVATRVDGVRVSVFAGGQGATWEAKGGYFDNPASKVTSMPVLS